jgi:hypothetical protein
MIKKLHKLLYKNLNTPTHALRKGVSISTAQGLCGMYIPITQVCVTPTITKDPNEVTCISCKHHEEYVLWAIQNLM